MRIKSNYLLLTLIGVIILTTSAFAQRGQVTEYADPLTPSAKPTPIYFGPCGGVNIMGHSMDIPTFINDNLCPHFKNASGMGIFGGLTMEYLFGDVATSNSSIIGRIMYNTYPGSITVDAEGYEMRNPVNGEIVMTTVDNVMDIDYNVVTLEVMYKINPIPGWGLGIVVGPAFDYALTKNRKHSFNLLSPMNAQFRGEDFTEGQVVRFENNNQTAVLYDNEIENSSAIRLGLKAGIQYEILLGSKWYIAPAISYNFGITSLTSNYTWRVSPLQIGLDLRLAF